MAASVVTPGEPLCFYLLISTGLQVSNFRIGVTPSLGERVILGRSHPKVHPLPIYREKLILKSFLKQKIGIV
jgi:hypothetical protein